MKTRLFRITLTSLFILILLPSCNKEDYGDSGNLTPAKPIVLTRSQESFVKTNTTFALDLFKKAAGSASGTSMVISPLSVTFALGMVDNGADGVTRKEINDVLGYGEDGIEELNDYCKTMLKESSKVDPSTKVNIANAAVVNSRHGSLKKDFSSAIESYYDALVCNKDFSKEDVQKYVNDWCKKETKGMIPSILNEKVNPSLFAIFLNATYFKGIWSIKFKKQNTRKEKFTREDGSKVNVDMMRMNEKLFGCEVDNLCKVLSMNYGNGAYQMTILLPEEGVSLQELRDSLDSELWFDIKEHTGGVEADVKLPSFECDYFSDLKGILEEMGMRAAFQRADFSNMTDRKDLYIEKVLHRVKLKMNEEGTEAAAVTAIPVNYLVGLPSQPPSMTFHADHPFLYVINEVSTGAIFFIGQYTGKE